MPHVCPHCGEYALDSVRTPKRSLDYMLCNHCQRTTSTTIFPLFVITGTSGAGKTTLVPELRKRLPECIIFDKDLLLGLSGDRLQLFYNSWLLIAHSIAQGGRHTVICGTIMPWDLEQCPDRGLVGTIHFLNLHCNGQEPNRLKATGL